MATVQLSVTQNFLKPEVIDRVFEKYVNIPPSLDVVDIGAGTGNITSWLAKHAKNHIVAFELDTILASGLRELFSHTSRVTVVERNFLLSDTMRTDYSVVANIPFMFTTAIIKKLTEDTHFKEGYLILQQEAAFRFGGMQVGKPGGIQSTLLNLDFDMEILHTFTARDFTPAPQVTSVLLHISRRGSLLGTSARQEFSDFISYLYNKSLPVIRKAPVLGRYLARKIDLGRIPILRKKPSELAVRDIIYLFSLCDEMVLQKLQGFDEKIRQESSSIKKIYRSRTASNWRKT